MGGMGTPGHRNGDTVTHYDRLVRARQIIELRRAGKDWADIANEVGLGSRGRACTEGKWALEQARSEMYGEADLYRIESLERLTALLNAHWDKAMKGDDKATTQCRLLISQMGDLTGEKAPVRVEIGEGDVDRLLRDAEAEIGRRAIALDVQAARVAREAGAGPTSDDG